MNKHGIVGVSSQQQLLHCRPYYYCRRSRHSPLYQRPRRVTSGVGAGAEGTRAARFLPSPAGFHWAHNNHKVCSFQNDHLTACLPCVECGLPLLWLENRTSGSISFSCWIDEWKPMVGFEKLSGVSFRQLSVVCSKYINISLPDILQ